MNYLLNVYTIYLNKLSNLWIYLKILYIVKEIDFEILFNNFKFKN